MSNPEIELQKIYGCLAGKNVLIIESPLVASALLDRAIIMQNMLGKTLGSMLLPVANREMMLTDYMEQNKYDVVVVHPHGGCIEEIQRTIDSGTHIIILRDPYSVDSTMRDAIDQWEKNGVPVVDKPSGGSGFLQKTIDAMARFFSSSSSS